MGADEFEICSVVNRVIQNRGGIAAGLGDDQLCLPLPVAGIMTTADGDAVAREYQQIDRFAKSQLGITLTAPFMTLSFMALLVIPSLKLSDQGLFDAAVVSVRQLTLLSAHSPAGAVARFPSPAPFV